MSYRTCRSSGHGCECPTTVLITEVAGTGIEVLLQNLLEVLGTGMNVLQNLQIRVRV